MSGIFTSVLNRDNAMDRMCKSIGPDTTAEILEKGKSELIDYQEAGHKLFKEHKELALKLKGL